MSLTKEVTKVSPLKTNEQVLQNVITCVGNLSLVSSTCDEVSISCTATKDKHPVVQSVCNIPEMGIEMVATAAAHGVQPILTKPEPPITIINEHAFQGVDELEEKLPVLQQPVDKVILDTKEPLSTTGNNAEEAISSTVAEVKNIVTGVTVITPEAAQGSVDAAESTATESTVAQEGANNTFAMLWKLDSWVDPFLPVTGQRLVRLPSPLESFKEVYAEQPGDPNSYCVHLGKLPSKVCQRFVTKMKDTVQRVQGALFHLQITIDLIEYSKRTADKKSPDVQEELNMMWLTWSSAELEMDERESLKPEPMESQILLVFRNIIQRLLPACFELHFNTQGFPSQVQEWVHQLESIVDYFQDCTCTAASFQDFSGNMLEHSKLKILKARVLLHDLLDYVIENITLTWLVEPLASSKGQAEGTKVPEETNQPSSHQSK